MMLSTDAGNGCTTLRPSLQADFLVNLCPRGAGARAG
jgi:hypothetical protein